MKLFIQIALACSLAACGAAEQGGSDEAGPERSVSSNSNDAAVSCREYVTELVASQCANWVLSNVGGGRAPEPRSRPSGPCELASYSSGILGEATKYADIDGAAIAHNMGQEVDSDTIVSQCRAGASIGVSEICDSTGASGC